MLKNLSILDMSLKVKSILSVFFISFGGLSIHLQVISSLDDKIRYRNYLIGRIYQMIISGIIAFTRVWNSILYF